MKIIIILHPRNIDRNFYGVQNKGITQVTVKMFKMNGTCDIKMKASCRWCLGWCKKFKTIDPWLEDFNVQSIYAAICSRTDHFVWQKKSWFFF